MPSDERGLYIKVYIDQTRDLIQRCGLTRAEIGELLIVALRINANNRCYPSNARLAQDAGKTDRSTVSTIHRHLRAKGALDWTQDADKRTNTYLVPLCFSFGSEVSQNHNTSVGKSQHSVGNNLQGGVGNNLQGGVGNNLQGGVGNNLHKVDTDEQESVFNKIQTEQQSGQPFGLALKSPERDPSKQILLIRALLDSDVDDREAYLIVQQFDAQTIKETIQASTTKAMQNKGGWIRSVIERKAGKIIEYPGQQHSTAPQRKNRQGESAEFHKQLSEAIKSARAIDRYMADPYFRQFEDQEVNQT